MAAAGSGCAQGAVGCEERCTLHLSPVGITVSLQRGARQSLFLWDKTSVPGVLSDTVRLTQASPSTRAHQALREPDKQLIFPRLHLSVVEGFRTVLP